MIVVLFIPTMIIIRGEIVISSITMVVITIISIPSTKKVNPLTVRLEH